jgi:hypothetical protein
MYVIQLDYIESDPSMFYPVPAFVGPFVSRKDAEDYMNSYPDGDDDLIDINVYYMNPLEDALPHPGYTVPSLAVEHWARRLVGKEFE